MSYGHKEEKSDHFRISAFVLTAFDRMLEVFPLYYVGKLCVLLSLLVEPSCLNERLKEILKITVSLNLFSLNHFTESV